MLLKGISNTQGVDWVLLSLSHHGPGQLIAPCHSRGKPSVNLPASSEHWSMTHPSPKAEIFTFWVSRCREMECYDCLYFPYFVVTRSLIAIKIFNYLAKCLKCLEEFWLPHWSINHLRRVSVSKIMTSSTQGAASLSSHWSEPAMSSYSLAELSCFSLGF